MLRPEADVMKVMSRMLTLAREAMALETDAFRVIEIQAGMGLLALRAKESDWPGLVQKLAELEKK